MFCWFIDIITSEYEEPPGFFIRATEPISYTTRTKVCPCFYFKFLYFIFCLLLDALHRGGKGKEASFRSLRQRFKKKSIYPKTNDSPDIRLGSESFWFPNFQKTKIFLVWFIFNFRGVLFAWQKRSIYC